MGKKQERAARAFPRVENAVRKRREVLRALRRGDSTAFSLQKDLDAQIAALSAVELAAYGRSLPSASPAQLDRILQEGAGLVDTLMAYTEKLPAEMQAQLEPTISATHEARAQAEHSHGPRIAAWMVEHSECYFCGAPAKSIEHIPARAFFPEQKDLGDVHGDLRVNLVTVPSCDAHNEAYSDEDAVAAFAIARAAGNNDVAKDHVATKVARAVRKDSRLSRVIGSSGDGGVAHDTNIEGSAIEAIDRVIEKIARGLHLHQFDARMDAGAKLRVLSSAFHREHGAPNRFKVLDAQFDAVRGAQRRDGSVGSPRVFRYEILPEATERVPRFRLTFYDATRFIVEHVPTPATHGVRANSPRVHSRRG